MKSVNSQNSRDMRMLLDHERARIRFARGDGAKIKINMSGDWLAKISFDGLRANRVFQ
jgi:hypothetical protein